MMMMSYLMDFCVNVDIFYIYTIVNASKLDTSKKVKVKKDEIY